MKRFILPAFLAFLIASCSSGVGGPVKPLVETPYYPLKVGTTWTYGVGGEKTKVVHKVVKHEQMGNMMCARIESSVDGKLVGTEHIGATDQGVYRCALNGKLPSTPILILKLPLTLNEEWSIDVKVGGDRLSGKMKVRTDTQTIKVPLGEFKDPMLVDSDLEANGQRLGAHTYFFKDIGIFKTQIVLGGKGADTELEQFVPAK